MNLYTVGYDSILLRPITSTYRDEVFRVSPKIKGDDRLLMGALGLAGEGGEVIDLIKKYKFQGKVLDREEMIKELGDVRWYFECLLIAMDTTIEEVEQVNIAKLRKRYPNGFTPADAIARKDEKPEPVPSSYCSDCKKDQGSYMNYMYHRHLDHGGT